MTITWPTTGTTICHGSTRTVGEAMGPENLTLDVQPGLIPREYVEGGGPEFDATGNDAAAIAFTVHIICTTAAVAAALVASLALTSRTGTLTLQNGTVLSGAGLTRIQPRQYGRSVRCAYEFRGHITAA